MIDYNFVDFNGAKIFEINCKKSDVPIYSKDRFYVRSDPKTEELSGPNLVAYVEKHFTKIEGD